MSEKYNADSIKVLKSLQAIRLRPGMYIGGVSDDGIYRLFREILDNSVDEFQAGHNEHISVWWKKDQVWIGDAGRGIPIEKHKEEGISTLTVLFTKTHAGGKFDSKSYSVSSGLNGVGTKAVNALSEWLEVYTKRKGKWWYQRFEKGKVIDVPVKVKEKRLPKLKGASQMSTIIGFSPDTSIMESKKIPLKRMVEEIQDLSYLCSGLTFVLYNLEKKKKKVWKQTGGIKQYVEDLYESTYHKKVFHVSSEDMKIDVALRWTNQEASEVLSYVNRSFTNEGGTHVTGLNKAVSAVLKRYGSGLEPSDLRAGMCGIIHINMSDPMYRGQTKDELTSAEIDKEVYAFVKTELDLFFKKNTAVANHIIKRAKTMAKARKQADTIKESLNAVKIEKKGKRGVLPGKLAEAPNCKPHEREIFLVEGESAGGSVKLARDGYYQEVLPLKGKIPNSFRAQSSKLLANEEISNINTSLGTHVGSKFRLDNCRCGKILILTDADPDGKHIAALLIAYFGKYMPDLIRDGRLYLVNSPLYRGFYKDKHKFGFTMEELRKKFPSNASIQISRLKGHGECLVPCSPVITDKGLISLKQLYKGEHVSISSLGKSNRISHVYKTEDKRKIWKIETTRGYTLEGSKSHPLPVMNNSGDLMVSSLCNTFGNYVAIMRGNNIWSYTDCKLKSYYNYRKGDLYQNLTFPTKMSPKLAYICGNLIGNGSGADSISCFHHKVLFKVQRYIQDLFNHTCDLSRSYGDKDSWSLRINNVAVKEFLYLLIKKGKTAHNKQIPKEVLTSSKKCIAYFIKGLFDADGCYVNTSLKAEHIEWYTASSILFSQVKELLNNFGIIFTSIIENDVYNPFTGKNQIGVSSYSIVITGKDIDLYFNMIGFYKYSKEKKEKCVGNVKRNTNKDVIPFLKERIQFLKETYRTSKSSRYYVKDGKTFCLDFGYFSIAKDFTYETLDAIYPTLYSSVKILDKELAEFIKWCYTYKPYWDKVVKVEETDKYAYLYDVSISSKLFVSGCILNHNCNPTDVEEYALNPKTRKLTKVNWDEDSIQIIEQILGADSTYRKQILGV